MNDMPREEMVTQPMQQRVLRGMYVRQQLMSTQRALWIMSPRRWAILCASVARSSNDS